MGKFQSKLRTLYRPVKNFNIEERAMKSISEEKRATAPSYPSMKKMMEVVKNDPELMNKGKVDPKVLENLSKIHITSRGDNAVIMRKLSSLPQERKSSVDYMYGYEEPPNIRPGKISLRRALDILNKHQADEVANNAESLAKEYNLDLENVHNMLIYFKTFEVIIPKKELKPPQRNPLRYLQQKMDEIKE